MEGDRPLRTPISSPIESRSVPPSSSKADRVQGECESDLVASGLSIQSLIARDKVNECVKLTLEILFSLQLLIARRLQLSSSRAF